MFLTERKPNYFCAPRCATFSYASGAEILINALFPFFSGFLIKSELELRIWRTNFLKSLLVYLDFKAKLVRQMRTNWCARCANVLSAPECATFRAPDAYELVRQMRNFARKVGGGLTNYGVEYFIYTPLIRPFFSSFSYTLHTVHICAPRCPTFGARNAQK